MIPRLTLSGTQWMLLTMGGLFILLPSFAVLWKLLFRLRCEIAEGTVLRIDEWVDEELESKRISPIIAFRTSQGRDMELKPGIGYGLKYLPAVGSKLTVYYLPETPDRAHVASPGLWSVAGTLMLAGVSILLLTFLIND